MTRSILACSVLLSLAVLLIPEIAHAAGVHILTRRQWGADHSLLYQDAYPRTQQVEQTEPEHGDHKVSQRVKDCQEWQRLYPEDFRTIRTEKFDVR